MTRKDRRAINRQNSQASTGATSAAGKEASKMNAVKHGLTAADPILPTDSRADYEAHKAHWFEALLPEGFVEIGLVQTILDTYWRVNRVPAIEEKLFAQDLDALKLIKALDNLSRHEMRLRKLIEKTLSQLVTVQKIRCNMQHHRSLPAKPKDNGFVLPNFDQLTQGMTPDEAMAFLEDSMVNENPDEGQAPKLAEAA